MHYRSGGSTVFIIKHPKFWKSSNDKNLNRNFQGWNVILTIFLSLKNNLFEFYSKSYANEIKFILRIRSENNISDELIYLDLIPEHVLNTKIKWARTVIRSIWFKFVSGFISTTYVLNLTPTSLYKEFINSIYSSLPNRVALEIYWWEGMTLGYLSILNLTRLEIEVLF